MPRSHEGQGRSDVATKGNAEKASSSLSLVLGICVGPFGLGGRPGLDFLSGGLAIGNTPSDAPECSPLTDDHRMLLQIRDTLYEGSWEDFVRDLEARAAGRPHVFELVPASAQMKATIAGHLRMIDEMRKWEATLGRPLRPNEHSPAGSS